MRVFVTLSLATLLSACGFTSPGGGTGTLFVTARLTSDGSTSGSRARITVRSLSASGDLVGDAEVAIRGGALARTLVPFDERDGQYQLEGFTWVEAFRLEILRGRDLLDGAIDAPGPTLITNPIADSTFRRAENQPLIVRWKDEAQRFANSTTVRLEKAQVERAMVPGVVELRVDPADLKVTDKERVRVERTNDVNLAGGVTGSVLSASTDHSIEFGVE